MKERIKPEISFEPVLPGSLSAKCKEVDFSWTGPEGQSSNSPIFVPKFPEKGGAQVKLATSLNFGSNDKIPFDSEKLFPVSVLAFEDQVNISIEPPSFFMPVDSSKKFICKIQPKSGKETSKEENEFFILSV